MTERLDSAINHAVEFLLNMRRYGLWQDFVLAPGWSDEWVTGYAGTSLATAVGVHPCLGESWTLLQFRARSRTAGWGYNMFVPQDADSTSWVLRLAQVLGVESDPLCVVARESLSEFRHPNGMLGTYGPTDEIRKFIGASPDRSFVGWTSPHACVTAAAAGVPGVIAPHVLVEAQRADGSWHSYWWEVDAFATALAAQSCTDSKSRERAGAWALARLEDSSWCGAFELANLIAITIHAGMKRDARVAMAVETLIALQENNGQWPASARMRVPDPGDSNPDDRTDWSEGGRIEGAIVIDQRGIFTTATALRALTSYRA
jgi:hypothetical protein